MFVCVSALLRASGQTPAWSLDSCVEYALKHNCAILLQDVEVRKSRANLAQSKLSLLPALNLYANQYYNWGRSVDMQELVIVRNRLTRQTSFSVGASFLIFDGFAGINTVEMHRHLARAANDNLRRTALDIKAETARAYLANILAKLSRRQLEKSLDNVLQQASRASSANRLGAVGRGDVLELEAKAADIRSRIVSAGSEEATQMEQLRTLLGGEVFFDTDTCIATANIPDSYPEWAFQELVPPGIKAAQSELAAAKSGVRAAIGAALPTLSVSAAYGTYYSDAADEKFKDQIESNRNPSVSLSLNLPLFGGGKAATAIAIARNDLEAAEIKLNQARQEAAVYQSQLIGQCETLRSQTEATQARVDLLQERLQIASEEYSLGAITTSEWIDADEELLQGSCEHLQTLCKYLFQLKIMEFYIDECR